MMLKLLCFVGSMYKVEEEHVADSTYLWEAETCVFSRTGGGALSRALLPPFTTHNPPRTTTLLLCSWRLISPESYCRSTAQSRRYYKGSSPPSFIWISTWPSIMPPFYSNDHFQPFRGWSLWQFFFSIVTSKNISNSSLLQNN